VNQEQINLEEAVEVHEDMRQPVNQVVMVVVVLLF
jgi:hypothetical protein